MPCRGPRSSSSWFGCSSSRSTSSGNVKLHLDFTTGPVDMGQDHRLRSTVVWLQGAVCRKNDLADSLRVEFEDDKGQRGLAWVLCGSRLLGSWDNLVRGPMGPGRFAVSIRSSFGFPGRSPVPGRDNQEARDSQFAPWFLPGPLHRACHTSLHGRNRVGGSPATDGYLRRSGLNRGRISRDGRRSFAGQDEAGQQRDEEMDG